MFNMNQRVKHKETGAVYLTVAPINAGAEGTAVWLNADFKELLVIPTELLETTDEPMEAGEYSHLVINTRTDGERTDMTRHVEAVGISGMVASYVDLKNILRENLPITLEELEKSLEAQGV